MHIKIMDSYTLSIARIHFFLSKELLFNPSAGLFRRKKFAGYVKLILSRLIRSRNLRYKMGKKLEKKKKKQVTLLLCDLFMFNLLSRHISLPTYVLISNFLCQQVEQANIGQTITLHTVLKTFRFYS